MPKNQTQRNSDIKQRVIENATNIGNIFELIKEIKDNHLKHLDAKIDQYHGESMKKIDNIQWFIITTLLGLVMLLARVFFQ